MLPAKGNSYFQYNVTIFHKPESFPITKIKPCVSKFISVLFLLDGELHENDWCPPSKGSRVSLTAT